MTDDGPIKPICLPCRVAEISGLPEVHDECIERLDGSRRCSCECHEGER